MKENWWDGILPKIILDKFKIYEMGTEMKYKSRWNET